MKAEALQHEDVKGRKLLYIKVSNGEHNVFINVGEKTFNSVKELEKVQKLPFDPDEQPNFKGTPGDEEFAGTDEENLAASKAKKGGRK